MQTYIPQPPSLKGDERAQLEQMYRYLYKMSEQLNSALAVTDREYQIVVQTKSGSAPGSESPISPQLDAQYRELRSLIIKTADIVNQQMDKTIKQLNGKFEAISNEWGTFEQNIERKIVETAEATIDSFDYSEKIHGIEKTVLDGVTSYAIESLGYIKRGIIGFDDENFPIYGIAVGTELKEKTVEKDGKTYQQIDTTKRIATYTSDAITFWRNDVAIARFSGDELYVTRAEITQQIRLGDWFFSVAESGGLNISKRLGSAIDISENGMITSLVGDINEANTSISQTQNDITALAKRASTAEEKISSTESKLELKADSAALSVVQEDVDSLSGRVSTAESKLELKADSATLSVTETNLKQYVTDAVDNISVGGRNLYTGTRNVDGDAWIDKAGWTEDGSYNGCLAYKRVTRWNGLKQKIALEANTQYTLSAWLKQTDGGDVRYYDSVGDTYSPQSGSAVTVGTDWSRCHFTVTISTAGTYAPRFEQDSAGHSLWVAGLKLEKGNKSTDWSPAPEDVNAALNQQAAEFANIVTRIDGDLSSLQSQVDGSITTWFYEVAPTLENVPAKDWTTEDDKNVHLGDLYYDTVTGYCYRWQVQNKVYGWQRITDTDVTKALADAKNAQDTADGKRRVFVVEPTPPYDVGDVWMQGADGDILRCQTKKIEGQSYAAADWVKGSKYTNDDKANEAMDKANANAEAIETNRSELTLTKNSLTALVERTTAVEDRMTTAESKIDQKADSITLSVLETKVDGISVGGTNILRGTNAIELANLPAEWSAAKWRVQQSTSSVIDIADAPNPNIKKGLRLSTASATVQNHAVQDNIPLAVGEEYTISVYARCTEGTANLNMVLTGLGTHITELTAEDNQWKRCSVTLTNDAATKNCYIGCDAGKVGTIEICGMQLEKGNKATDWSPAPEDPAGSLSVSSDYSKVDINTERVRIVSKRMEVAVPSDDGEDDVLRVDADGVHAEVVEADQIVSESVVHTQGAASYTPANAGELAAILEELSGKHLMGYVTINCASITSGSYAIRNISGGGTIALTGGTMNQMTIEHCTTMIYMKGIAFSNSGTALTVSRSPNVYANICVFNAGVGVNLNAEWFAQMLMNSCSGDCTVLANVGMGSQLRCIGASKPTGTVSLTYGGEVYNATSDPTFAAKESPSIPTTQTVTVSLSPTQTYTLRGTSNSDGNKLYQGRYSSSQSLRKGVMLFTLPSDLTSANNIDSATLTLRRIAGAGQGGGVTVQVRCYNVTGTLYASKTAYEGQTVSIDVTSAVKAMKTNGYTGLMLYNPDTTTVGSKSYTASYARFAGKGESGAPVLKVSYRK